MKMLTITGKVSLFTFVSFEWKEHKGIIIDPDLIVGMRHLMCTGLEGSVSGNHMPQWDAMRAVAVAQFVLVNTIHDNVFHSRTEIIMCASFLREVLGFPKNKTTFFSQGAPDSLAWTPVAVRNLSSIGSSQSWIRTESRCTFFLGWLI